MAESRQRWHVDVHEDLTRRVARGRRADFEAIAGFADNGDAALELEEGFEALAEELVVVSQHDPNGWRWGGAFRGRD